MTSLALDVQPGANPIISGTGAGKNAVSRARAPDAPSGE